jgi:hypothetical protein
MPFTSLKLHPDLLTAIRELGFVRPTPIQTEAIPPDRSFLVIVASFPYVLALWADGSWWANFHWLQSKKKGASYLAPPECGDQAAA